MKMKSIKSYYQQSTLFNKENRYFLLFNILFIIRIVSALPIALYKVKLVGSQYSYQKYVTLLMIFLAIFIFFKEQEKFKAFIQEWKNTLIILGFIVIGGCINGLITFDHYQISLQAPIISTSRFVFLVTIFCIVNLFKHSIHETWIDLNIKFLIFYVLGIGLLMFVFSLSETIQKVPRLTGPFLHPNQFGYMLLLIITLSLYKWKETKNYIFYGLSFLLSTFLLFKTGSMNSVLAFMFFAGLLIIRFKLYKNKYIIGVTVIGIIIVVILFPSVVGIYMHRLSDSFDFKNGFTLSSGSSLRWRFETWYGYLEFMTEEIYTYFFGTGMGAHRFLFDYKFENNLSEECFWSPGTHNDYLAFFFDFGILGCLFVSYLIYKMVMFFGEKLKSQSETLYLRFFFFTLLFMMIFDNFIDSLMGYYTLYIFSMTLLKPNAENYTTESK